MITDIATLIKTKRKEKGLTQKELAEGICAQAVISKIEKMKQHRQSICFLNWLKD